MMKEGISQRQKMKVFICNADGVIFHELHSLSGVLSFIKQVRPAPQNVLFLTSTSHLSPGELREKLIRTGVELDESDLHTSALTAIEFLTQQASSRGNVFMIGEHDFQHDPHKVHSLHKKSAPEDYIVIGFTGKKTAGSLSTSSQRKGKFQDLATRRGKGPGQGFYRK